MNIEELKKKSPEDLKRELDSLELDLLRLSAQTGSKEAGRIRELKRTIARIRTLQSVVKNKEVRANK